MLWLYCGKIKYFEVSNRSPSWLWFCFLGFANKSKKQDDSCMTHLDPIVIWSIITLYYTKHGHCKCKTLITLWTHKRRIISCPCEQTMGKIECINYEKDLSVLCFAMSCFFTKIVPLPSLTRRVIRLKYFRRSTSISWLLMFWLVASSTSTVLTLQDKPVIVFRIDFSYLHHLRNKSEKW